MTRLLASAFLPVLLLVCPAYAQTPRHEVVLPVWVQTSPNQDDRPAGTVIDTIVVHDTKSPGVNDAGGIAHYFSLKSAEVSAHYVIGKDGEVIQCVPDAKRAWHAGPSHYKGRKKVNDFSIGIELVNDETGHDPFTDEQYATLVALAADLVTRYHIPPDRITGHRFVTDYPKERQDPADNFDWARFRTGLKDALATKRIRRTTAEILAIPAAAGTATGPARVAPPRP